MNNDYLLQLDESARRDWERAKEIVDGAAAEKREMTAEESANFDQFNAEFDRKSNRAKEIREAEARAKAADELRAKYTQVLAPNAGDRTPNDTAILRQLALATRDGGARSATFDYSDGFESRALATGTATVPVRFADFVAVYQRTMNPTYGDATVLRSASGENLTIPRLTTDLTSYTPGEGTAITESTPTLSAVTLTVTAYKGLSYISQELAQDQAVGIEELIARSAARQIALTAGTEFTTGTSGFIANGTSGATASGTPFFLATDIITLYYSLAQPYRMSGTWHVSNGALSKIRSFQATTNQFLWDMGNLATGQPESLLGRPVHENPAMAAVASASKSVAFGDFSAYIIKEVVPMRVESSSEFLFNTDQIAYKTVWRAGGALPDAIAIKYLVSNNS